MMKDRGIDGHNYLLRIYMNFHRPVIATQYRGPTNNAAISDGNNNGRAFQLNNTTLQHAERKGHLRVS